MRKIKLDKFYIVRDFTPKETFRILRLIKSVNVENTAGLEKGIKTVQKVVRLAVGTKKFKCTNKELIGAFLEILDMLPVQEYYEISQIVTNINRIKQK